MTSHNSNTKPGDCRAEDSVSKPVNRLEPGLYTIATPIGNLRDITLRALDILKGCDVIACEDSRITRRLLAAYDVATPVITYHDHNAASMRPKILARLEAGETVALVTDAGTPLVSDPGYKLVRDAIEAGAAVHPIPGPSAPVTALAAAGLPSDQFLFAGFPPNKKAARLKFLEGFGSVEATLIFFESPKRLRDTIADMAALWPDRAAVVARELTKKFEEFRRGTLSELTEQYAQAPDPKGEIVILVGPPAAAEAALSEEDLDALIREALATQSVRDAAVDLARTTGLPKKRIYQRALALNADGGAS